MDELGRRSMQPSAPPLIKKDGSLSKIAVAVGDRGGISSFVVVALAVVSLISIAHVIPERSLIF